MDCNLINVWACALDAHAHFSRCTQALLVTLLTNITREVLTLKNQMKRSSKEERLGVKIVAANWCLNLCLVTSFADNSLPAHDGTHSGEKWNKSNQCDQCDFASSQKHHLRTQIGVSTCVWWQALLIIACLHTTDPKPHHHHHSGCSHQNHNDPHNHHHHDNDHRWMVWQQTDISRWETVQTKPPSRPLPLHWLAFDFD